MRKLLVPMLALVSGCTVGPDYQRPEVAVPQTWSGASATTQPATRAVVAGLPTAVEWWRAFEDPQLTILIERATEANLDLRIATSRVREARALRGVSAADRWPTVNTNASYQRSRQSENVNPFEVEIPGIPSGQGFDPNFGGVEQDLWQGGFDASWELDVFGRVRRSVEAANADIDAAVEGRRDVLVTLLSEVALNYVELRGLQRELEITRANVESQQETVTLAAARFRAGIASEFDVVRAQAQVASTRARIPALESRIRQSIHRLSVLAGREPGALSAELAGHGSIPVGPPEVPLGLPSDLLKRRPDIRRAEREIHAASARVGVATADLFPRFALTGTLALQSDRLGNIGSWDSRYWSAGPSVTWPIFDAGRIRSNIRVQDARQEQAALNYERAVLVALEEVENALTAYAKEQQRRQSLAEAVEANRRSVQLSEEIFNRGLADFLNVLDSQRALYLTEEALVQSDRAVSVALVQLYKALGGGWERPGDGGNDEESKSEIRNPKSESMTKSE